MTEVIGQLMVISKKIGKQQKLYSFTEIAEAKDL